MTFSIRTRRFLIAALLFGFVIPIPAFADQASDDYKLAQGHFARKRWTFAEEAFQKFLADHPKHPLSPLGNFYLGLVRVNLKKYLEARTTLENFNKNFPNSKEVPHAKYRIGECSYHLKEYVRASEEFNAFVTAYMKDPFNEWAWAYLGDSQRNLQKYEDAIRSLNKSLELFPNGRMADEARFGLAESNLALKRTAEALKIYRQIAGNENSTRAAGSQLQIGNILFGQRHYGDAANEYLLIEKKFPKSGFAPVASLNAGFSYYQLADYSKALAQFDKAEADPSQAITSAYWKGLSLKSLRDFTRAADVLADAAKKVKKGDPLEESVVYQQADCEFKAGKLDKAVDTFLLVTRRSLAKG